MKSFKVTKSVSFNPEWDIHKMYKMLWKSKQQARWRDIVWDLWMSVLVFVPIHEVDSGLLITLDEKLHNHWHIRIHPSGAMDICIKCNGNPSSICQNQSSASTNQHCLISDITLHDQWVFMSLKFVRFRELISK